MKSVSSYCITVLVGEVEFVIVYPHVFRWGELAFVLNPFRVVHLNSQLL